MLLDTGSVPDHIKFFIGGLSGIITTLIVHPFDFIKTRMQISGQDVLRNSLTSNLDIIKDVIQNEGFFVLYAGLTAALLRQATYTSAKLGLYNLLYEKYTVGDHQPDLVMKMCFGMISGIVGSCIGTPSEIALIRMTADGILPVDQKRNYHNVFHALVRIVKDEGFFGLWKSVLPTMNRGAIVSLVQLATYSQAKQMIIEINHFKDGVLVHLLASMISGFNTAFVSMPADMIKTRIQNMRIVNGVPEYSSSWNVFCRICQNEGFRSLWKGFLPYFLKIFSNTVFMFIIFEQLTSYYRIYLASK